MQIRIEFVRLDLLENDHRKTKKLRNLSFIVLYVLFLGKNNMLFSESVSVLTDNAGFKSGSTTLEVIYISKLFCYIELHPGRLLKYKLVLGQIHP